MDDKSLNIRVPRRWVRIALIVGVTALVVAPLTAVASHSFTDVPDTHTFHEDIEWLKDTGVTIGCNPPENTEFCPERFTSRGEMSAFMHRYAQFIDAEDGTPGEADNADTLDGFDAEALASRAGFASSDDLPDEATSLEDTIVAPAAGIIVVSGSADVGVTADGTPDSLVCVATLDGNEIEGSSMSISSDDTNDDVGDEICSTNAATVVGAGTYEVGFAVTPEAASAYDLGAGTMTAVWVPFDGSGEVPTP
jgi:hypothetical protein